MIKALMPSRPPGYAPRGTSLGLGGLMVLPGAIPAAIMESLIPVFRTGIDNLLAVLPICLPIAFIAILVVSFSLHKRRLWFIYFVFYGGCVVIISYATGLLLAAAVALHLMPLQQPDLYKLAFFNLFYWCLLGIPVWWTLRMIRLRYWQPWTAAEQWEPGDETGPRWAQRLRERS